MNKTKLESTSRKLASYSKIIKPVHSIPLNDIVKVPCKVPKAFLPVHYQSYKENIVCTLRTI